MYTQLRPADTWTKSEPAVNTDASVVLAAAVGRCNAVTTILYSYDSAPTGGALRISFGATEKIEISITAAGPGVITLPTPLKNPTENDTLTVTLLAAGAACTGKVNVGSYLEAATVGVIR